MEAISISLNAEFGDSYEIHMEEIKQGLKEPCFFMFARHGRALTGESPERA
jgi:hypothetical protein